MNTITIRNVRFGYPGTADVIHDLSLTLHQNEIILLIGENGAGKSTLLKLLNGILKPRSGTIQVNGCDTASTSTAMLAREIAITFQNPGDQLFASTVWDEVAFSPTCLERTTIAELVHRSLNLFGLTAVAQRHPYDLHHAQRKLITLASAFAADTPFLAFDEPSAGLSMVEQPIIDSVFAAARSDQKTMIVISHDLQVFLPVATRLLVLKQGSLAYDGSPEGIIEREELLRQSGLRLPLGLRLEKYLGL